MAGTVVGRLHGLAEQAIAQFGVLAIAMAHRVVVVGPQEPIVAIHVGSPHRKEAFRSLLNGSSTNSRSRRPCGKKKSPVKASLGKPDLADGENTMDKEIEGIVEIGSKPIVERRATATGVLNLSQASAEAIQHKLSRKGMCLKLRPSQRFKRSRILHVLSLIAIQSL